METGLQSLYQALQLYKVSLVETLEEIDQNVLEAVNKFANVQQSDNKFKISIQIVEMLPRYIEMLTIGKTIFAEFKSKTSELEQDSPSQRNYSNPFLPNYEEKHQGEELNFETVIDSERNTLIREYFEQKENSPQTSGISKNKSESDLGTFLNITEASSSNNKILEQRNEDFESYDLSSNFCREDINLDYSSASSSEDSQFEETPQKLSVLEPEKCRKTERRVTFNIPSKNEEPKTSVTKSNIIFNSREDALKVLENKNSRKNIKEKSAIFEIPVDDQLYVHQGCFFINVESPSKFYVCTDSALFESLDTAINEELNRQCQYVVNKFKTKVEAKKKLGDFCFGFVTEKRKWFRVQVVDWWPKESDYLSILLIDYGIKTHCSYKYLKSMTELYATFPKMAIRCHFAGVYSPNPLSKTKWPQISIDFLRKLSEKRKMTKFVTIYVHKEGDSYAVDLHKENHLNESSVGETLVQKGYACQVVINDDSEDAELEEEAENINELIAGYDAKDEERLCPFTDSSGKCFKGAHCKLEHGRLSKDGTTTDRLLTVREALHKFPLPLEGQAVQILVTGYIDTCSFYAHILNQRDDTNLYNDNFQQLQETMKTNNLVQSYEPFRVYPGLGELVLVKDGQNWLRGNCVGYAENDDIEIFFVDFGFTKSKKLKDLRQMQEDFLYVPFQAVHCMIHDCQEKKDLGKDHSFQFFNTCMYMHIFRGVVYESVEPLRLQLWDSNGMDMSYVLKEIGLGESRIDLRPARNSILSVE